MLLPWHATGTLNSRDARRVEEALERDPGLAKQYAVIREEYAETIGLNESLGAPSSRAMQKLFAAIDAEPARPPRRPANVIARIADIFVSLSPRTLAWSASLGALALVLQAGVIGAMLMKNQEANYQTASLSMNERCVCATGAAASRPPRALVRFSRMRRCLISRAARQLQCLDRDAPRAACSACSSATRRWRRTRRRAVQQAAGREDRQSRGGGAIGV